MMGVDVSRSSKDAEDEPEDEGEAKSEQKVGQKWTDFVSDRRGTLTNRQSEKRLEKAVGVCVHLSSKEICH